jgi:hypothetical protein
MQAAGARPGRWQQAAAKIANRADFANHVSSHGRTAYEGHVAQRKTEPIVPAGHRNPSSP